MNRTLGHRAPLLWLVLPFLAGLAAGRAGLPAPVPWLLGGALLASTLAAWAARRGSRGWSGLLVLAMFLAGDASHALHRRHLPVRERLPPREAELELKVERLFASHWPNRLVGLARVTAAQPHLRELRGQRLYVSLSIPPGTPPLIVSTRLAVIGVLGALPADAASDTFDGYLADSGVNFRLERGRVLRELAPASAYRRFCTAAAARFEAILAIDTAQRPTDLAAAYRAMVLGRQQELSEEQVRDFRLSGTMHIFSISGLHIAVIAIALQTGLVALRLPLAVRLAVELGALWLYVDITGTAPSAVRAFVMVAMVRIAFTLRRPLNPLAALTASMGAVLLTTPLQVFSASFQMSYGIVAALVLLGLPLDEAWRARWAPGRSLPEADWWWHHAAHWLWNKLRPAVALGLAAAAVGTVTSLHFFRMFTPGGLLVNLALIPLSGAVIWAGLLSLLAGLAGLDAWSALFNRAALVVLWFSEQAISLALRLPAMWFEGRFLRPWLGEVALVALLGLLLGGYALAWPRRLGGLWAPFVFVALLLLLAVKYS